MSPQSTVHSPRYRRALSPYQSVSLICGLWSVVCGLCLTGCIRRSLTVRSNPAGAELSLNDKRVGRTPYTEDFLWYGLYKVSLTKSGYERFDDQVLIKAPVYFWIPFDLVMELLPVPIHDDRALSYTLTPTVPLQEPSPPPRTSSKVKGKSAAPLFSLPAPKGKTTEPPPAQETSTRPAEHSQDTAR